VTKKSNCLRNFRSAGLEQKERENRCPTVGRPGINWSLVSRSFLERRWRRLDLCEQRITAIEEQSKKSNRRSIFINGRFVLGVDESVVAELGLRVGQPMTAEMLESVVRAELVTKAKQKALKLLEYRPRSRKEIASRLAMAGFEEDVVEEALTRLEELGFINDAEFSRAWVNHRVTDNAMGSARIKWELRHKGISTEVVEEALSVVDADTEYRSAMDAAKHRWERDKDPDEWSKRRRLASYLRRRGFDWDIINKVLDELAGNDGLD